MIKKALILMCAAEAVSLLAFHFPVLSLPLLIAAGLGALILSLKNPEAGVYILFGELFFGSRGHLLEYNLGFASISLRLIVFVAVFCVWLMRFVILRYPEGSRDSLASTLQNDKFKWLYSLLLIVIGLGIIIGYLNGNSIANIFNDANGYLYLLILPVVFSVIKTRQQVQNLLEVLGAAVLVIAAKTLLLFTWFTFGLPGVASAYHWVISQDFGEITGEVGSASRIFMQSQFYSLMALFVFSLPFLSLRGVPIPNRDDAAISKTMRWLILSAALLSVLMSLSRSFWLGAVAGGFFALVVVLVSFRSYIKPFLALGVKLALILLLEIGLLYGLTMMAGAAVADSVASRGSNPAAEAAGGARLLLLPELLTAIKKSPILGSGFGTLVSYKSYLPDRITQANPDGTITSYAFEWSYLDIILKIGLVGLLAYLFFIADIFQRWMKIKNLKIKMQNLGVLSGLVALIILNITTPYLNHPLGIGYVILCMLCFRILDFEL